MTRVSRFIAAVICGLSCCVAAPVQAQGLLFTLPEDKTGVQYQGTITQETIRDDIAEGKEVIQKSRQLIIKSVGREDAEYDGVVQPCRWVEIKTVTGDSGAAGIVTGPVGSRIYKVLIPESKIIDQPMDTESVPNIMLPIIKGFRRSGESEVRPIRSKALAIYPTICQLMFYPSLDVVAASEAPQVVAQNLSFSAKHVKASMVMERPESRTTNEAHMWITPEVPFGLARWEVTVTREKKESTATRDSFAEFSTTKSAMSVSAILNNVESELVTQ